MLALAGTILTLFYFLGCEGNRESNLTHQGNEFVRKIELYKKTNSTLPKSLSDIGIIVRDECDPPIYYDKKDSIHYTLSFVIVLGESKIYYSDTKKWEEKYREMK